MFIEELLKQREPLWGQYHPSGKHKSVVMARNVGCVFVGSVEECTQYIRDNKHRYAGERGRNPEVTQ